MNRVVRSAAYGGPKILRIEEEALAVVAHRHLESNQKMGKVVVSTALPPKQIQE